MWWNGLARSWLLAVLAVGCLACAAGSPAGAAGAALPPAPGRVPPERLLCGWEEQPDGAAGVVRLDGRSGAEDGVAGVVPAAPVVLLSVAPALRYAQVMARLEPARHAIVRLKLVLDDRWLLPVTLRPERVERPAPERAVESIVGHHRITRDKYAPRVRIASLRVQQQRAQLFVEQEHPDGQTIVVAALREHVAKLSPAVDTFVVTADEATSWQQFLDVARALACYDRGPGEEPHEVIIDYHVGYGRRPTR